MLDRPLKPPFPAICRLFPRYQHQTNTSPMKTTLLLLTFFASVSFAQTNLSGGIYASETWTLAGSPYTVSGNLVVFDGVEITVEPGVIVQFNQNASLELRGKLTAIGTSSDWIYFTSSSAQPIMNSWYGITVLGTSQTPINQVTMEYVKGMYSTTFINLDAAYNGPYNFKHCYFAQNAKVNEDGGAPSTNFDYCTFEANAQALDWCQFDNRASHCSFINNAIGLVGIEKVDTCYFRGHTDFALAPYGVTTGCNIENNVVGVKTGFNSVNHTFVNNTIMYNEIGIEIDSYFNGSQTFTGNKICSNSEYNLKLLSSNNADLGYNCWCSTDISQIQETIYDGYDNTAYGLVSLPPVIEDCGHPLIATTPELPISNLAVTIYPNPFSEIIHFQTETEQEVTLAIFDINGRLVTTEQFHFETSINGAELGAGIYLYTMTSEDGASMKGKLVKE